jgi:hypothetical protein
MRESIRRVLWPLLSQEHAVTNAREASTPLARRRIEAEDVRLFLESLEHRRRSAHSA